MQVTIIKLVLLLGELAVENMEHQESMSMWRDSEIGLTSKSDSEDSNRKATSFNCNVLRLLTSLLIIQNRIFVIKPK